AGQGAVVAFLQKPRLDPSGRRGRAGGEEAAGHRRTGAAVEIVDDLPLGKTAPAGEVDLAGPHAAEEHGDVGELLAAIDAPFAPLPQVGGPGAEGFLRLGRLGRRFASVKPQRREAARRRRGLEEIPAVHTGAALVATLSAAASARIGHDRSSLREIMAKSWLEGKGGAGEAVRLSGSRRVEYTTCLSEAAS